MATLRPWKKGKIDTPLTPPRSSTSAGWEKWINSTMDELPRQRPCAGALLGLRFERLHPWAVPVVPPTCVVTRSVVMLIPNVKESAMNINKSLLREKLVEIIAHRVEWCGDNEFEWAGAACDLGYAAEAEDVGTFPEIGKFSAAIPLSILGTDEMDVNAHIVVTVDLVDLEEL